MKKSRHSWKSLLAALLVFVAFGALWARSYHRTTSIKVITPGNHIEWLASYNGNVEIFITSIRTGRKLGSSLQLQEAEPANIQFFTSALATAASKKLQWFDFGASTGNASTFAQPLSGQ